MKSYKTNDLNKKIELQEMTKAEDGAGGFEVHWEKVKDLWAKVELLLNITNKNFDVLQLKATHLVVVRRLNNINTNMRFLYNGSIFSIKYINNLDNYFTEIICNEE